MTAPSADLDAGVAGTASVSIHVTQLAAAATPPEGQSLTARLQDIPLAGTHKAAPSAARAAPGPEAALVALSIAGLAMLCRRRPR